MNDTEYRAFLDLMMCSDPWPIDDDGIDHELLEAFADAQAKKRGFTCWIEAYHRHNVSDRP